MLYLPYVRRKGLPDGDYRHEQRQEPLVFNYGINLLKSDDLIHWTSTTFDFRQGPGIFCDPQSPDVYKDYSTIKRVWAPQIFWDLRTYGPMARRADT